MKSLISKLKPVVIDNFKNLLFGAGAILVVATILAIIGLVFEVGSSVIEIGFWLNYLMFVVALSTLGKFIREKVQK